MIYIRGYFSSAVAASFCWLLLQSTLQAPWKRPGGGGTWGQSSWPIARIFEWPFYFAAVFIFGIIYVVLPIALTKTLATNRGYVVTGLSASITIIAVLATYHLYISSNPGYILHIAFWAIVINVTQSLFVLMMTMAFEKTPTARDRSEITEDLDIRLINAAVEWIQKFAKRAARFFAHPSTDDK